MQQRTTRVNASEETIKIGPLGIRFLLTGDDSNGSVSVFEVLVPVGQKLAAPAHKNDAYEEILYGIEGVLTWTVDGTPIEVGPGQALCIPRGAVHRFDNLGNEDVKQLAVISPAIMGPAYFREAAEVSTLRPAARHGRLPPSWHDAGRAPPSQWLIAAKTGSNARGTAKRSLPISGRCGELNTGTLPSRPHAIRDSAESV